MDAWLTKNNMSEDDYEVEKILAEKRDPKKGLMYKVKWKGYAEDECTW